MSAEVADVQQEADEHVLTLKVINVYPVSVYTRYNENLSEIAEQHGITLMDLTAARRYTDDGLYLRRRTGDDILKVHNEIQQYDAETLLVVVDHEIAGKIVISVNAVFTDPDNFMLFKLKHWNDCVT